MIYLLNRSPSPKTAFIRGWCFGFSFFSFGLSWIGNAVLIDNTFLCWLYPLIFLACGIFFGLFVAVPAWLSFYFRKPVAQYLAFCALVVLFEWLRSFFLTGFPWNLWGTVLAFSTPLIQLSSVGGTYLLSLIALLICGAPFLWLADPGRGRLLLSTGIITALSGFIIAFGLLRLSSETPAASPTVIRIVQPSIPQTFKWDNASLEQNLDSYIELSRQKPLDGVSAVIWGETASPFPLDIDEAHNYKVRAAIPDSGYLITGLVRYHFKNGGSRASNSMMVFDKSGNPAAYYDKSHLVPFGEYIPLRSWLPDWLRPLANTVGTFTPGKGPEVISLPGLPDLGAIICYEAIFPGRIINPDHRPQWVINPTNDGWYGDSFGPRQHFVATRLRAVEEGVTIVRAANNGISGVISPYGTVLARLNLNQKGVADAALPAQMSFPTPYGKYGNVIILFICTFLLYIAFLIRPKPNK